MRLTTHALTLALALALGTTWFAGCGRSEQGAPAKTGKAMAPKSVRAAKVDRRFVERVIIVTGTLAAQEKSVLSAKVAGRVQQLLVDVGSVVRQGDLLAQVEPRDYELNLQQAAAALAQARATLGLSPEGTDDQIELERVSGVKQARAVLEEASKNQDRVKSLSQSGIASQSEVDTVESAYTVAQSRYETALQDARTRLASVAQYRAQYDLARKHLADASVCAPFDGAIQSRRANLGEYVAVGTPIVELVKTDPLRLRLHVPERESALVRAGQSVRLLVEGDAQAYAGQIARLSPALDDQTRMLLVEADVPAKGKLRPGLFARAHILVNEGEETLTVPSAAVITFAGIEKVVTFRNGQALEKVVTTGQHGTNWIEIVTGLGAGDEVALNPAGLRTGQPVTLAAEPDPPATRSLLSAPALTPKAPAAPASN